MRTQVGIVGAGPAGLVLAHLLHLRGIESVVLEARSREYVEQPDPRGRARAGHGRPARSRRASASGCGARGSCTRASSCSSRASATGSTSPRSPAGAAITVYGQQEVVKDLIAARLETGRPLLFEVDDVALADVESDSAGDPLPPRGRASTSSRCDFVAGCDGFHGVCREAIPRRRAARVRRASTRSAGSASSPRPRRRTRS